MSNFLNAFVMAIVLFPNLKSLYEEFSLPATAENKRRQRIYLVLISWALLVYLYLGSQ